MKTNNIFKHVRIFNNFISHGKIENISLNTRVAQKISPPEK